LLSLVRCSRLICSDCLRSPAPSNRPAVPPPLALPSEPPPPPFDGAGRRSPPLSCGGAWGRGYEPCHSGNRALGFRAITCVRPRRTNARISSGGASAPPDVRKSALQRRRVSSGGASAPPDVRKAGLQRRRVSSGGASAPPDVRSAANAPPRRRAHRNEAKGASRGVPELGNTNQ